MTGRNRLRLFGVLGMDTAADKDRNRSESIPEFCLAEGISKSSYYKLKKLGLAPDELRPPGTAIVRITTQARTAWHMRMEELRKSQAAELEAARRHAQTAAAGKRAAESPLHVSKRRKAIRHGTRARQLKGGVR
jgi:hypothetical protein